MKLKAGDRAFLGEREFLVTELAATCLPEVRAYLIGVARAGGTVTYGEVKRDLELSYSPNGMGYLLDVVSADCAERGEPSLAALVVAVGTFEVGRGYTTDPEIERELLNRRWLSKTVEGGGLEQLGPIRGVCPNCGSADVTRIVWGLVGPETYNDPQQPPWITFGGCLIEPYDAICGACDQKWWATEDGSSALLRAPSDLYFYAQAHSDGDLAAWISASTDLDAFVDHDNDEPDRLIVAFHHGGIVIDFPLTLAEFWGTTQEFHDQIVEELEEANKSD